MNSVNGFAFLALTEKKYLLHWDGRKVFDLTEKNFYVSGLTVF